MAIFSILLLFSCSSCIAFQAQSLSQARYGMKSVYAGGYALFAGGFAASGKPSATVDFYRVTSPWTDSSIVTAQLSSAMLGHFAGGAVPKDQADPVFLVGTGLQPSLPSRSVDMITFQSIAKGPNITSLPSFMPDPIMDAAAAGVGDVIIIGGGRYAVGNNSNSFYSYNVTKNTLTNFGAIGNGAYAIATAAIADAVIFSGGMGLNGPVTDVVIFDISAGTTAIFQYTITTPRYAHAVGLTSTYFVVAGGITAGSLPTNSVEITDRASASAVTLGMSTARYDLAGGCGAFGCMFVGGTDGANVSRVMDAVVLAPGPTVVPSTFGYAVTGSSGLLTAGDALMIAGGQSDAGTALYDFTLLVLQDLVVLASVISTPTTAQLSQARNRLAVAAYGDVVMFFGGNSASPRGTPLASAAVDIYNATSGIMTNTTTTTARYDLCGCTAGSVLVFGGGMTYTSDIYVTPLCLNAGTSSAELTLYDVPSGQWATHQLGVARYSLACAAAGDFAVFSGGTSDSSGATRNVDILAISSGLVTATLLNFPRTRHRGIAPVSSVVCFLGGINVVDYQTKTECLSLPTGNATTYYADLLYARADFAIAMYADSPQYEAFVGGGMTSGPPTSSIELLRYQGTTLASNLTVGAHNAVAMSNLALQQLLVVGGIDATSEALPQMLICTYGYCGTSMLKYARGYHVGAAITSANMWIVAGGSNSSSVLSSVEIFTEVSTRTNMPVTVPPTLSASPAPACAGSPPAPGAVCVNGVWVIGNNTNTGNFTISPGQTVIINGTLTLIPTGTTIINADPNGSQPPISVSGSILIDGTLILVLGDIAVDGTIVPIISGSGEINGSFTGITVTSPEECQKIGGSSVQTATSYGVLLSVDDSGCGSSKGLSTAAIAGIVVGSVIFLAIIATVALLVYCRMRPRGNWLRSKKRRPQHYVDDGLYAS